MRWLAARAARLALRPAVQPGRRILHCARALLTRARARAGKRLPGAPHEVLLVLDATTGARPPPGRCAQPHPCRRAARRRWPEACAGFQPLLCIKRQPCCVCASRTHCTRLSTPAGAACSGAAHACAVHGGAARVRGRDAPRHAGLIALDRARAPPTLRRCEARSRRGCPDAHAARAQG